MSGSLKILDNVSVILSTKVRKNMIPIHLVAFHPLQALGAAKGFINPIRPGGGGSEARMTKLTADNQKPLTR